MENLNTRRREILKFVIESYIKQASPVGSKTLSRIPEMSLSASTVRNEMGLLEELGYITHPHTSAGRMPTDKGYRYYIETLMGPNPLELKQLGQLKNEYANRFRNVEDIFERTLKVLSSFSRQTGLVFMPESDNFILKSVSLVQMEGSLLLAVWLSTAGLTKSFLVDMGERLEDEEISDLNRFLNKELEGMSCDEIQDVVEKKLMACRDSLKALYKRAQQIIEEVSGDITHEKIYLNGSAEMLDQPEFQDLEKTKAILKILETKKAIQKLLRSDLNMPGISIHIGSEIDDVSFSECSMISAPYYFGKKKMGSIGILGPSRMQYGKMIDLVSHVSEMMSLSFKRWL